MTIILLFFFLYSLTSKCAKAYFLFNVSTANFILRIDVIFFTFFIFLMSGVDDVTESWLCVVSTIAINLPKKKQKTKVSIDYFLPKSAFQKHIQKYFYIKDLIPLFYEFEVKEKIFILKKTKEGSKISFKFVRNKFKIPVSYPENRFNTILSCVLDSKNHIRRFVKRFKNVSVNTNNLTLTYNLLDIESLFSKMRFPLIERPVNRDFYQGMYFHVLRDRLVEYFKKRNSNVSDDILIQIHEFLFVLFFNIFYKKQNILDIKFKARHIHILHNNAYTCSIFGTDLDYVYSCYESINGKRQLVFYETRRMIISSENQIVHSFFKYILKHLYKSRYKELTKETERIYKLFFYFLDLKLERKSENNL